jgi:hypothetical protein
MSCHDREVETKYQVPQTPTSLRAAALLIYVRKYHMSIHLKQVQYRDVKAGCRITVYTAPLLRQLT